jgi:thiamine-monophosphate kinase
VPPGEFELIARLQAAFANRRDEVARGIGDDCAVLADGTCLSCDLLVEDVHFRRATTSPEDLGFKALAVNLSDLAAMGAEPVCALTGLVLPPTVAVEEVDALAAGLEACAAAHGVQVAGGDISRGPVLVVSVTVLGRAQRPVTRDGARPGDVLAVTGPLGGSRAGLSLLESGRPEAAPALVDRHRRPRPRLSEGRALAPHVHAMLDVSDGLASDAQRICEASGVACSIDLDAVPVEPGCDAVARSEGVSPGWFATAGGEDYELLVALPREALETCGVPLWPVGEVRAGRPAVRYRGDGAASPPRGWDHLSRAGTGPAGEEARVADATPRRRPATG